MIVKKVDRKFQGFSLLEMLLVLSIMSLLSALIFPVFNTVRGKARQAACQSNLRQIGQTFSMYIQDYDGIYPYAVDAGDRYSSSIWSQYPDFQNEIPEMDMVQEVLLPYYHSSQLFRCPSDSGYLIDDFTDTALDAVPSSFEKFGTSYGYRTEIAQKHISESAIEMPSEVNVLFDACGRWHGSLFPLFQRYNVLFADGHVKNLNKEQLLVVWSSPLNEALEPQILGQEDELR